MEIKDGVLNNVSYEETDGEFVIPEGVTSIGVKVFGNRVNLTSIDIPESVMSIGDYAFFLSGITKVKIPGSVTSMGDHVFSNCCLLTLVDIQEGVTSIGDYAFSDCSSLTSITIPNSVTSIGKSAFYYCSGLESLIIPGSVMNIGDYTFRGCNNLVSVDIQEGVTSIGDHAFCDCSSLTSIIIPGSVTSIGNYAFSGCSSLTSVGIQEGVTSIGDSAFFDCSGLESIIIPGSVTEIGYQTFSGCSNLALVDIQEGVTSIDFYAFSDCSSLTSITIPNSVTSIGWHAFENCSSLTSIIIPGSVTEIGYQTFSGCSNLALVDIQEGVTSIGDRAFCDCSSLTSIIIPGSVTSIGNYAFSGCSSLTSVGIQEGVTSIGESAFSDCSGLESIIIPGSVMNIGDYAFSGCSSLTLVDIPEGVTSIGDCAFFECSSLTSVSIPDSVTGIGNHIFDGCSNLKSIVIGSHRTSIDKKLFYGCDSLENIRFNNPKFNISGCIDMLNGQFDKMYLNQDGSFDICSSNSNIKHDKDAYVLDLKNRYCLNDNYRLNYLQVHNWKQEGKVKFVPPDYTLSVFPESQIDKYFINNNSKRWGQLVKELGFDNLEKNEKENSLVDLMKIYYSIGGFSENQGESENAYKYIKQYVARTENENASASEIGAEIHRRFSKIDLKDSYNKDFAKFFMKYYKDNPDFMNFSLTDLDGNSMESQDYLCTACNSFSAIQKNYPNMLVNTTERRALLSPQFVAERCAIVLYNNVEEGNETLASLVGRYGYSQEQFNEIQNIYNSAKALKDTCIIKADKAKETDCVKYRFLEKDDPIGFILGDITNCCQTIKNAGGSCVEDGYLNNNAGFMVFEETIKDEFGNPTENTRILGQAYVWYDPETKTVCYDNIEIPSKVLGELTKPTAEVNMDKLLEAVEESASAIMNAMNKDGDIKVERVTTGRGYNDLSSALDKRYEEERNPIAQHRGYTGYSDAIDAQYILKTYNDITNGYADAIRQNIKNAEQNISDMQNPIQEVPPCSQ